MSQEPVPTPSEIWKILKEVSLSQKETDRKMQETDQQIRETGRQIKKLEDIFSNRWGQIQHSQLMRS